MSTLAVNAVTDANGGNTATINSMTPTESNMMGKNRIINGDMRIAQRGTAAVTANGAFPVDRFSVGEDSTGAYSGQQDSSAPVGFVNSLKFTTTTADTSIAAGELCFLRQFVEGTNVSDLAWGTASAKSVTLSFWVRSSLTGSFSGAIANDGYNRSYPFLYTIAVADTWEYKTVTIPGDTTGTWLTTTGIGLRIYWNLGTGTDNTGTAGAWVGAGNVGADSTVAVIGTLNATWYITGVQLEVGSVATPFERRPYGAELALCQRYFYMLCNGASQTIPTGSYYSATLVATTVQLPIEMRTSPSIYQVSGTNYFGIYTNNARDDFNAFTSLVRASSRCVALDASGGGVSGTVGHSGPIEAIDAAARLGFSAEL
jgi:hypothetical protein